jgi:hypothetical protein
MDPGLGKVKPGAVALTTARVLGHAIFTETEMPKLVRQAGCHLRLNATTRAGSHRDSEFDPGGLSTAWKSPQPRVRFRGSVNYRKLAFPRPPTPEKRVLPPVDMSQSVSGDDLVYFVIQAMETMKL